MKFTFFNLLSSVICLLLFYYPASSDPQTHLLWTDCNSYNASNPSILASNRNSLFRSLRSGLNPTGFATAYVNHTIEAVYGVAQCRRYLSAADCIACFSAAARHLQVSCTDSSGARAVYDGCFLRYEYQEFYDQAAQPGSKVFCGSGTVGGGGGGDDFSGTARDFLMDLCTAAPRIDQFFATAKKEIMMGKMVYGVAQCLPTVGENGCEECLREAFGNIGGCLPSADGRATDAGCFLRYSDTAFFGNDQAMDLAPFLEKGLSSNKTAIIGGSAGAAAFIVILVLLFALFQRRKEADKTQNRGILRATELRGPTNFDYRDLKSATGNFSEENKLGEGGFGSVYKGVMKNGKIVAVKQLMLRQPGRAEEDFNSEVKLISNIHHRNLARLLGCCNNGPELLLVYEYMVNGSLDKFLFGDKHGTLNWKQRFDIIVGVARGLAYMHEEFHVCIIHRDIKSSNILLDDELQPRIADFGLVKLLPDDWTHLSTRVAGTLGYTAPEYALHGQLSEKADTYSYGVVVLEIISGQRSNDMKIEPVTQYLLEWAWRLYEEDSLMELVDKSLDLSEYTADEVKKAIEIGLMCTQAPSSRPTMSQVVVMLLSLGGPGINLSRPAFIGTTYKPQNRAVRDASASTASSTSNATLSITQLSAR